jgi:hypothetical protein
MLVSVVSECGVAADDWRVSQVRVEKIIQTLVCQSWDEHDC